MVCVSFFSYKGGAGRTSLMINTLPHLAEKLHATEKEPIIVLDLDLDSKGLSYLIEQESKFNTIQVLRGDSAIGFRQMGNISEHPFFKELAPIGAAVGLDAALDRSFLFVSANSKEGAEFLSDNGNYDGSNISLQTLRRMCRNFNCKAIVMDTPAGNQLSAECALSISNKIVVAMRITRQFRKGTEEFLRKKSESNNSEKEYIIVPNAVPPVEGTPFSIDNIMHDISSSVCNAVGEAARVNLNLIQNGHNGINEVGLFKFREDSLYRIAHDRELTADEKRAVESYKMLAEEIIKVNE